MWPYFNCIVKTALTAFGRDGTLLLFRVPLFGLWHILEQNHIGL